MTIMRRRFPAFLFLLAMISWRAEAVELWQTLPPTPAAVSGGGYADVNASVPAFNRYVAEPGLAVGRIGNGPWSSFATSPTRLLATFGYVCGLNSNGYNWSCGPAGAFPT